MPREQEKKTEVVQGTPWGAHIWSLKSQVKKVFEEGVVNCVICCWKIKKGENRELTTGVCIVEVTVDLNYKDYDDIVEVEASVGSYGNVRRVPDIEYKQCLWGVLL